VIPGRVDLTGESVDVSLVGGLDGPVDLGR
jgi:hypothetical protein